MFATKKFYDNDASFFKATMYSNPYDHDSSSKLTIYTDHIYDETSPSLKVEAKTPVMRYNIFVPYTSVNSFNNNSQLIVVNGRKYLIFVAGDDCDKIVIVDIEAKVISTSEFIDAKNIVLMPKNEDYREFTGSVNIGLSWTRKDGTSAIGYYIIFNNESDNVLHMFCKNNIVIGDTQKVEVIIEDPEIQLIEDTTSDSDNVIDLQKYICCDPDDNDVIGRLEWLKSNIYNDEGMLSYLKPADRSELYVRVCRIIELIKELREKKH